jgi:hypothetical protein
MAKTRHAAAWAKAVWDSGLEATPMHNLVVLTSVVVALAAGADDTGKPWSMNPLPGDVEKSHVEEITAGPHSYKIVQGGTMDGRSCRSPMGCGMSREGAFFQTWQSNRSVRMENVGRTDVVSPWLSNGRNGFRSVEEIVSSAVAAGMTDAEKAFALWFQQIRHRHHSPAKCGSSTPRRSCGAERRCSPRLPSVSAARPGST